MRSVLVFGLLFCIISSITIAAGREHGREDKGAAQVADAKSTNDQIEVKTDRFSNVVTVVLKPQVILDKPDHQLTMGIEAKLGEKKFSDWEREEIKAIANFESQAKEPIDYGDADLHFLIDGKPLNQGKADINPHPYGDRKPGFKSKKTFVTIFNRRALEQFSVASSIEMRIGIVELKFSKPITANLREYASQVLAQHKIAKEKKP